MEVRASYSQKSEVPKWPNSIGRSRGENFSRKNSCVEKTRFQALRALRLIRNSADLMPVILAAGWIFFIVQNAKEIKPLVSKLFSQ